MPMRLDCFVKLICQAALKYYQLALNIACLTQFVRSITDRYSQHCVTVWIIKCIDVRQNILLASVSVFYEIHSTRRLPFILKFTRNFFISHISFSWFWMRFYHIGLLWFDQYCSFNHGDWRRH